MNTGQLLEAILPRQRIKARLIDLAAYAPDAGFYYLLPKAVVQPVSEEEIIALFNFSQKQHIPLTFRTGGTSLSGQAISGGILVDLSMYWNRLDVEAGGTRIRVQPGVIGAMANARLRQYRRKIGPDPASINSAMMGGILSNNASGMCCGVSRNSYHTTRYIRFILPNGKRYSTENKEDYMRFRDECPEIYDCLLALREQISSRPDLHELIRKKYKTKNTVGYSVNAFIDHDHPLDILAHLLIGAEGTLGFISEAVLETVPDYPAKSTALLYFHDIFEACKTIGPLTAAGAEAVELMDRASLHSVVHIKGIPEPIRTLPAAAAALLVEFQGNTPEVVRGKIDTFLALTPALSLLNPPEFTENPLEQAFLWKVRKGLFPAIGAVRESGTSVILEDIAFPVEKLSEAVLDLQGLFVKHGYDKAIIFGHAKDGNIHFVITQAFDTPGKVERYRAFLDEVVALVVNKYQGALKAEHGTGRNMAPFVETEWGGEIYRVMKTLKACIDPGNLLNPGVIINEDPQAHIRDLKEMPQVESEVDKCMECGFCEYKCPSRNLTLTPRQRIVVRRELAKMEKTGDGENHRLLLEQYQYDGLDTCAVDGLCATACPVDINTGALVKRLRKENHSKTANKLALRAAKHFNALEIAIKGGLQVGNAFNGLFGKNTMRRLTGSLKKIIPALPLWSNQLRPAPPVSRLLARKVESSEAAAVYFPTCISRVMGVTPGNDKSIAETFMRVSSKAGVPVMIHEEIGGTCCGQPFSSKGFTGAFAHTANRTVEKLWNWTGQGRLPVVLDITSCTHTLQGCRPLLTAENQQRFDSLRIIDSIDFIADYLLPKALVRRKKAKIVLHPVCSLQHMGLENKFQAIAAQLAEDVTVPLKAGCCGMAGDRGFLFPELTDSATAPEAAEVKQQEYEGYYSSAKTCEMAMSEAVKKNYQSLVYLLDECI
ncbi:FAD-binding and (Fe-S)-binding domain-containing protein [Anseongella ginsenosidimutans]|nr:FAD-binding and (Fe-S)-binding domain-containing protein [Anseongella ginsenosidimutans]QEC52667.1 FAD-binding oxidoreductase [Anseongella ginsenosidimutans]